MHDILYFTILPYVAMVIFFLVTIQRYRQSRFSYSSLSSQFLENQMHFWGSVPFHYGILLVLCGHIFAFLFPGTVLGWNAEPVRMFAIEVTGLGLAILALVGLVNIMVRRRTSKKARVVTTRNDWILYFLLLVQIVTGILVAVQNGWGSSWFATSVSPWLWSLITLQPKVAYVAGLSFVVKFHIINAFLLIGFFPFTRLVHILVVPNPYLWRKTQVVIWNRPRKPEGSK